MSKFMIAGRRTIARNTIALVGVQAGNVLIPLLTLPYLLRVLGVEQFGVYAFCQALLAYCVVLVDYGFNLSATRQIAQNQGKPKEINRIFWSVQAVKSLLALTALGLIGVSIWLVPQFRAVSLVLIASLPIVLGSLLFPLWLFQGLERMGFVTVCSLVSKLITIPLIFYFVQTTQDTWIAAMIQSIGTVIAGLLACVLIQQQCLIGWARPRWADVVHAFVDGWHIFISTAAISLYTTINPVLLGMLTNHTVVGLFSATDKIRLGCQSLISPFSTAIYPRVSALMEENPQTGLLLVRKVLLVQGGVTLCLAIGLWLAAPWLVLIVMGGQFEGAVSVLRIMAPLPFLIGLSNVFGIQTMLPLGLKKPFSRIVATSGLVSILLMVTLAPTYGADGAAAAVLVTESLVTLAMALVLRSARINLFTSKQNSNLAP